MTRSSTNKKINVLNKRCVVKVSGCSFTEPSEKATKRTWLSVLNENLPRLIYQNEFGNDIAYKQSFLYKQSSLGCGNYSIIGKMKEAFDNILKDIPKEILEDVEGTDKYAFIQLTGLNRYDVLNDDGNWLTAPSVTRLLDEETNMWKPIVEIGEKMYKFWQLQSFDGKDAKKMREAGSGYTINGQDTIDYFMNYFDKEYSTEKHIKDLLENIIDLQNDFKKNNINHRFFLAWDIFTNSEKLELTGNEEEQRIIPLKNHMWSEEYAYQNINNGLIIDNYPHLKELWDKVDWSKFWFFENEYVKYGGFNEWLKFNIPKEHWYVAKNDAHPSEYAHELFTQYVIYPLLVNMVLETNKK